MPWIYDTNKSQYIVSFGDYIKTPRMDPRFCEFCCCYFSFSPTNENIFCLFRELSKTFLYWSHKYQETSFEWTSINPLSTHNVEFHKIFIDIYIYIDIYTYKWCHSDLDKINNCLRWVETSEYLYIVYTIEYL